VPDSPPPNTPALPFDRILCINLDRRPDRWQGFLASATPHIPHQRLERFPALDAQTMLIPSWWRGTPGAYACMLSHRFAISCSFAAGADSVLIFEDDALLSPDFAAGLAAFLPAVPPDWQMLYLGGQHRPQFKPYPAAPGVLRCRHTIRLHAYAVHRRGAPLVHDCLARTAKDCDQALADLHPRLATYAPSRWLVAQRADFSDVESRRHPKDRWWAAP